MNEIEKDLFNKTLPNKTLPDLKKLKNKKVLLIKNNSFINWNASTNYSYYSNVNFR